MHSTKKTTTSAMHAEEIPVATFPCAFLLRRKKYPAGRMSSPIVKTTAIAAVLKNTSRFTPRKSPTPAVNTTYPINIATSATMRLTFARREELPSISTSCTGRDSDSPRSYPAKSIITRNRRQFKTSQKYGFPLPAQIIARRVGAYPYSCITCTKRGKSSNITEFSHTIYVNRSIMRTKPHI